MTNQSLYPHSEVLHSHGAETPGSPHGETSQDKVIKIRFNRSTLFSGILILFAIVVTAQFFQIRGISAKINSNTTSQQTQTQPVSSTTSRSTAQGSQSSGALQSLPSQVGGC